MKTKFQQSVKQLFVVMAVLLLTLASLSAVAQVNMNRQIVIHTNTTSALPRLVLAADTTNTPVKIVCGTWDTILYLDSISSRHFDPYIARCYYERFDSVNLFDTIMIYGDVSFFSTRLHWNVCRKFDFTANDMLRVVMCDSNIYLDSVVLGYQPRLEILTFGTTSLAGIDVSGCPSLKMVRSHETHFSAQAYDELMCQLPQWQPSDSAKFFISDYNGWVIDTSFSSSNSQIALAKNWTFYDRYIGPTTVQTTGTYLCPPQVRRIRLRVRSGNNISLNFAADTSDSPIRVVSGTTDRDYLADTVFTMRSIQVPADDTVMDIYGAVKVFQCYGNQNNVTALDLSQNPYLTRVECTGNALREVTFCGLNLLETLVLSSNNLTSIDLSHSPYLTSLDCSYNNISAIDLSGNPLLETFYCNNNSITSLDISNNPLLADIDCSHNSLSSLDFTANAAIEYVRCYGNSLSDRTLDEMMCSLPAVNSGILVPMGDVTDTNDAFYDANVRNAIAKHWSVFDSNNYQVHSTNGTYVCGQGIETAEHSRLTITPNPAKGSVTVGGMEGDTEISIIDLQGRTVKRQRATAGNAVIDIRELESGVYFLKTEKTCDKLIVR